MDASFSLGSNDGAKVLVNGAEAFSNPAPRGRKAKPHQDKFTVRLSEGPNEILVKVANYGANWRLFLAVEDPDRELEFDIRWQ